MRWDELFADLEAQAAVLASADVEAEVAERTRIETAQLHLADRLRAGVGGRLKFRCTGNLSCSGVLRQVASGWVLIDEGAGRELLVVATSILTISGLGRQATANIGGEVTARLGIGYALRRIARDRSAVRIHLQDATVVDGTIDRVGADFVEIAMHPVGEPRRRPEVRDMAAIAIAAIVAVRRDAD